MAAHEILREAGKLRSVSDSLEQLAAGNASMAEALTVLAGTVRQSAAMLEVMVEVRLGGCMPGSVNDAAESSSAHGNARAKNQSN